MRRGAARHVRARHAVASLVRALARLFEARVEQVDLFSVFLLDLPPLDFQSRRQQTLLDGPRLENEVDPAYLRVCRKVPEHGANPSQGHLDSVPRVRRQGIETEAGCNRVPALHIEQDDGREAWATVSKHTDLFEEEVLLDRRFDRARHDLLAGRQGKALAKASAYVDTAVANLRDVSCPQPAIGINGAGS